MTSVHVGNLIYPWFRDGGSIIMVISSVPVPANGFFLSLCHQHLVTQLLLATLSCISFFSIPPPLSGSIHRSCPLSGVIWPFFNIPSSDALLHLLMTVGRCHTWITFCYWYCNITINCLNIQTVCDAAGSGNNSRKIAEVVESLLTCCCLA